MNYVNIQHWQKPPQFSPTVEQKRLAQLFKVDPLIIYLLESRNISGVKAIDEFLHPSLAYLPDPFTMKDMDIAVSLVSDAIKTKAEIVIWGDYDVDGVTSTCLLVNFFKKIGIDVRWKIPDRFSEGYGLNVKGIENIRAVIKNDFPLLITVDCGISSHAEIKRAKELGFHTIVTDHHQPPENPVKADAILNVKQQSCPFIDKNLAGVGMAFYLAAGIRSHLKQEGYFENADDIPNLKQFLDYVAIGTIADMVSLTGINRILVKAGLEVLSSPTNIGVSALLTVCDLCKGVILSDDIIFQVAPKINAAGRMETADTAMNMLLSDDKETACQFAKNLSRLNEKRKKTCKDILESILSIDDNILIYNNNCIVLTGDFHQGVIGIVASQLVNKYNLPAILFTNDTSVNGRAVLKGSGRSISGIDIFGILKKCERFLLKFGGHTMAAGLSLFQENFELFRDEFSRILEEEMLGRQKNENFIIDADYSIEKLFDGGIVEQLQILEPFGVGNKKPIFLDSKALVYECHTIGYNGEHLRIAFRCKYSNRKGIGFNLGSRKELLQNNTSHHVVFTPTANRFKNSVSWEVRLHEIL
jgi:single-stranded-DNA-specific exonuclease